MERYSKGEKLMSPMHEHLIPSDARPARRTSALTLAFFAGLALAAVALVLSSGPVRGEALVPGFTDTEFADGVSNPTAMAFAPDGRLFVAQKTGQLRVITPTGQLLDRPFLNVRTNTAGERGLLGVAFDPQFETNGYVYVYYTARGPSIHNRVARFTADPQNPDVARGGSFRRIFELPPLQGDTHNGGAIHFGRDNKLYVAVGENRREQAAQSTRSLLGKMLRINRNGSIPSNNPYYRRTSGKFRAIWTRGLRNPYTFGVNQNTGTIFINDVGAQSREEINRGVRGANYGWPLYEGRENDPRFRDPILAYPHQGSEFTSGCAITGGAFYAPTTNTFGANYENDYFFGDFCNGWIRKRESENGNVSRFARTPNYGLVDIQVSEDGDLYYLHRATTSVRRIAAH